MNNPLIRSTHSASRNSIPTTLYNYLELGAYKNSNKNKNYNIRATRFHDPRHRCSMHRYTMQAATCDSLSCNPTPIPLLLTKIHRVMVTGRTTDQDPAREPSKYARYSNILVACPQHWIQHVTTAIISGLDIRDTTAVEESIIPFIARSCNF